MAGSWFTIIMLEQAVVEKLLCHVLSSISAEISHPLTDPGAVLRPTRAKNAARRGWASRPRGPRGSAATSTNRRLRTGRARVGRTSWWRSRLSSIDP